MILLGYNSPVGLNGDTYEINALVPFHIHLVMQRGAYRNAPWDISVAEAGRNEGFDMIGQSVIIAPSGEIVAMGRTTGDELIVHDCALDLRRHHRERSSVSRAIGDLMVERIGAEPPSRDHCPNDAELVLLRAVHTIARQIMLMILHDRPLRHWRDAQDR